MASEESLSASLMEDVAIEDPSSPSSDVVPEAQSPALPGPASDAQATERYVAVADQEVQASLPRHPATQCCECCHTRKCFCPFIVVDHPAVVSR